MTQAAEETSLPRWVKVTGLIVAIVALLVLAMLLLGGGFGGHGPGRHSVGQGGNTSSVVGSDEGGAHQRPQGGH